MNVIDLFDLSLQGHPQTVGLEFGVERWTFGELDKHSRCLAAWLSSEGLGRGDRVAVYLPNCVDLILSFLASVRLGAIFTPINILYRKREIGHILSDAGPRAVITNRAMENYLPRGARSWLIEEIAGKLDQKRLETERVPIEGDDPAVIVYTSGTTGRSKGATLSHNNLAANAMTLNTCWRMSPGDRMLLALPLFHVHGLGNALHTWLSTGFRMRLLERFRKETIVGDFLDFKPTVFFGVPAMYERLLDVSPEAARRIGSRMRLFVSGSAPLAANTLEGFRRLYGHTILERYGMSETLMNASNPYAGERRPGSVGKPLPGVSMRLVNPETGEAVPDGEAGEVWVKGSNVFSGYWRNEEATKEAFTPEGWFRTGDFGFRSADGYYTLCGRRSEIIISGGFNIYPREIEEFLREQPGVAEAAVVGEPDSIRGEMPVAYVVQKENERIDLNVLRGACSQALASFKIPKRFELCKELPRNALGKLQRHRISRFEKPASEW